jgi:uncharacterized protein (TIGR00369 family)
VTTRGTSTREEARVQALLAAAPGPERAFGVAPVTMVGDTASSSMTSGPWLNGPAGRPLSGALGVLIDNVLGYALLEHRPPGGWSVSAEISLDLCRPLPAGVTELSAWARAGHCGPGSGLAHGEVRDRDGRIVARCAQHGRWAPMPTLLPPAPAGTRPEPADAEQARAGAPDLAGLLGVRAHPAEDGARLELTVTRDLVNPLGNLHGGITLCLCDLVAQAAIGAVNGPPDTASVRVAYPRPLPLGTTARFECRVAHRGRSFAVAQVTVTSASGKPCVIATVTTGPGQGERNAVSDA